MPLVEPVMIAVLPERLRGAVGKSGVELAAEFPNIWVLVAGAEFVVCTVKI
jgi:hypothetical protein